MLLSALMEASSAVSSRAERRRLRAHRAVPGRPPSFPEPYKSQSRISPAPAVTVLLLGMPAGRHIEGSRENRRDVRVRACAWCISCV